MFSSLHVYNYQHAHLSSESFPHQENINSFSNVIRLLAPQSKYYQFWISYFKNTFYKEHHTFGHLEDTHTEPTSGLDLSYAHVHHHRSRCIVSFHQSREVTAVNLADVSQVGLAVVGHQRWALFVDVQTTI